MRALFPLRYGRWKLRMAGNLVREKREYVMLAAAALVLGISGIGAYEYYATTGLISLLRESSPQEANRILSIVAFSAYIAFALMALANVITRFFSAQRMSEREQLLGPLSGSLLFATELLDVLRLPLLILIIGFFLPLGVAAWSLHLPAWTLGLQWIALMAAYVQPTLFVMALYIAIVRYLPPALLSRQGLLFAFFFLLAGLGGLVLGALRSIYQSAEGWSAAFPTTWAMSIIPHVLGGSPHIAQRQALRVLILTGSIAIVAYILYRWSFIERLECFGIHLSAKEEGGGEARVDRVVRRILIRWFDAPIVGMVIKDLRSSRRDTAQKIAFTALAAVVLALIVVDILSHWHATKVILPILFLYALFLVSCQGLSTFSAEGGVLENLARFPLDADAILKAKIVSHALLFAAVSLAAIALNTLAPSPFPWLIRIPVALVFALLCLPTAIGLSWISVTLGAIFPKPGEGGGRKEISIFAMGLFFQLTLLAAVSIPASVATSIAFGVEYVLVIILMGILWFGILRFLYVMARRSVDRALGAEMRGG